MVGWPSDLGLAAFQSDEWRFAAVTVVVMGVAVVPSLLAYLHARRKAIDRHSIALMQAETALERARRRKRE